jgi:hypothetical protein
MPNGDGTGPLGRGPKSGRCMGRCLRCVFCPQSSLSKEEKLKLLKEEKDALEKEIVSIEKNK